MHVNRCLSRQYFFVLIMLSAFYICYIYLKSATYIKMHFKLDFNMEDNTMNPDQTAPLGAV